MHLKFEYPLFTHRVSIGKGHKRTSLPNTSCIFLQHPKLNPFLSLPSKNLGGRKDSKKNKKKIEYSTYLIHIDLTKHFNDTVKLEKLETMNSYMLYCRN